MNFLFYSSSILTFLFSVLLAVHNNTGLAWLGLIFGAAFSAWSGFCVFAFFKDKTEKKLFVLQKTLEYLPYLLMVCFVLSRVSTVDGLYVLDAVLALFWLFLVAFNWFLLFRLNPKRAKRYFPDVQETAPKKKKSVLFELLDWADAILQAACIVLLFNVFIFQLYMIPSESMVPEFMVNDRVFGLKLTAGPTFPLSSFRFPQLHRYKRGDVVIIRNPHYNDEPDNELKFFTSQFIQMLTLTTVNINKDKNGNVKPDPLVKRIVGGSGEKVMLVDGKLYIKKKGETNFALFDESAYAKWNLEALPPSEFKYVKEVKVDTEELTKMESVEAQRAALNFDEALREAGTLVEKMRRLRAKPDAAIPADGFLSQGQYLVNNMARDNGVITDKILTAEGGLSWFKSFLTDWKTVIDEGSFNLYETRNAQLGVLIKLAFGRLFVRNAELHAENALDERFASDEERAAVIAELENYLFYLEWSRQRNMNEFPAGDEYIPEDAYFMMGDNRFNSTDMRHEYRYHLEDLCKGDPLTPTFITNVRPQYVKSRQMLGTVNLILFPFGRFGLVK